MEKEVEDIILETLSFLEPMTKERLILDFDDTKLQLLESFTKEDLEMALTSLLKQRKIKKTTKGKEEYFQKCMPRRPWWRRFLP